MVGFWFGPPAIIASFTTRESAVRLRLRAYQDAMFQLER